MAKKSSSLAKPKRKGKVLTVRQKVKHVLTSEVIGMMFLVGLLPGMLQPLSHLQENAIVAGTKAQYLDHLMLFLLLLF